MFNEFNKIKSHLDQIHELLKEIPKSLTLLREINYKLGKIEKRLDHLENVLDKDFLEKQGMDFLKGLMDD